jgi:prevent-host-death family protein
METINITNARANLFNLVDSVVHGTPKCITTKNGSAVMVSLEEWEGIQETIYLMSDKKFFEEIKDRIKTLADECVDELEW